MDLTGKFVIVIGAKRSGVSAVTLLRRLAAHVRILDSDPEALRDANYPVYPQRVEFLGINGGDPDLIVLSPGVPYNLAMLEEVRGRGVPIVGEVELAGWFLQGPVIGITGSNGKTTTTALAGHLLQAFHVPCQVGGNIGTAVTSLVESSQPEQWNVLELSSFQLETTVEFRADVAVCLNVTPDHLDRHGSFENYAAAKARLFANQTAEHHAVLNLEDAVCRSFAATTKAQVHWFSSSQPVPRGVWMRDDQIFWDHRSLMHLQQIKLRGLHNVENVMAACLIALLAGGDPAKMGHAVASFPGVEHRIEFTRTLDGVDYFNDSKATNVDAALKAIHAFSGPLWIILGGKDKGGDYGPLREALGKYGRAALLIGAEPPYPYAASPLIAAALHDSLDVVPCGDLRSAVSYAREHAEPGHTVLLSPACASFDQFANYEERGRVFKQLVAELI